jgi:hypothetical protein
MQQLHEKVLAVSLCFIMQEHHSEDRLTRPDANCP